MCWSRHHKWHKSSEGETKRKFKTYLDWMITFKRKNIYDKETEKRRLLKEGKEIGKKEYGV